VLLDVLAKWRAKRSISLLFVFSLAVPVGLALAPTSPTAAASTWQTRSFYMGNASRPAAARLGCEQGDTQGRMTLFFGAPTTVDGTYGVTLWGGADRTASQVIDLAKDFVRGYAWCRRDASFQALVGIGTSTSGIDYKNDTWLVEHGSTWAWVVKQVAEWAEVYYPGVVQAYAAWDAEPSWSVVHKADMWMQGYNGHGGRRAMHIHDSADGCPRDSSDNGWCNNGWNQYWMWRLSWWYDPALPMPQIYATTGVNARQWQRIDEYGARHQGDGMFFYGVMAQRGACLQVGGCVATNNSPDEASNFLYLFLNSSDWTRQDSIETATDILWHR
jgi:hypothetical protein